jgi:hypothetical protein
MQLKKRPWPVELGRPIFLEDLQKTIRRDQGGKNFDIDLLNAVQEEQITRAEKICNFMSQYDDSGFLDSKLPATEGQWIYLVAVLCVYLDVPAFQVEMSRPLGPGATKFWTDRKLCQLFADVINLAKGNRSENGACRFIAAHPKKFGDRYLRKKGNPLEAKTLHRQFLTVKSKLKNQPAFRILMLRKKSTEYGPAFIEEAIKQFAFTRNSSGPNFA